MYVLTLEHHVITHHVYLLAEILTIILQIQRTLVVLKLPKVCQNVMNTFMTQSIVMMMWM